jgi:peptidoglycan/LPS O-acetylase OafA/YrhL
VVAHHAWQYSGHPTAVLGIWWEELALGVPLFFCLSGFLVYGPWARAAVDAAARSPRIGRFYALRAARILPLYYLTLVAAVLLLHGTGSPRLVEDARLLGFVVLAQNTSGELAGMLNPPTWSLTVEVAFYAALPAIGWLALSAGRARGRRTGRRGQLLVLSGLLVAGVVWSAATGHTAASPVIRTVLPDVLGVFCVGMAARVLVEGRGVSRGVGTALLVAGAGLVWAHGSGRLGAPLGGHLVDLPAAVGFAAICVSCSAPGAPRWLGSRPLAHLGARSYGIYLWHYPILLGLQAHGLLPVDDVWATTGLVGVLAVAASTLSWRLVEQPALVAVRQRLDRSARGPTAPDPGPGGRSTTRPRVSVST